VFGKVLTSTPPVVEAPARWGAGQLDDVLAKAAKALEIAPRDADIDYSTGWVKVVPEKAGRTLDVEASRRAVMEGVALGDSTVRLVTATTKASADPTVSKVILVRAGENKLYLYDNGRIVKSWPVATGSGGYLTPTGLWHVVDKIVGPVWYNPGGSWAKGLPARIGPGPGNPLGSHALELDAPAILIHATSDTGSIGYSVSHGCIRMTEADELELFNTVTPGTRVVIAQVAPPRPRGAPVAETAATLF
jgi:lipoprotein-anchoring transpeptidase ErfK/SrfK